MRNKLLILSLIIETFSLVACNGASNSTNIPPTACANGANQCGATVQFNKYNVPFSSVSDNITSTSGSLVTTNNMTIAPGMSNVYKGSGIQFSVGVSGITSPVTVYFDVNNGGTLSLKNHQDQFTIGNSYTFGDN